MTHSKQAHERRSRVSLTVIYNHRHDRNIDRIERLYGERFDKIFHLVPFYEGQRANVIPVSYGSFYFQGYVYQAQPVLAPLECAHHAFMADDVLLHPRLNSENLASELGLGETGAYVKELIPLSDVSFQWIHLLNCLKAFQQFNNIKWEPFLPSRDEASARMARMGVRLRKIGGRNFRVERRFWNTFTLRNVIKAVLHLAQSRTRALPYPMVKAYSDFFVVPSAELPRLARICGVFAAMNLFAEVALPTAMVLACDRLLRERDVGWSGREIWNKQAVARFEQEHELVLARLTARMGERDLYVHPVKLSKWRLDPPETGP